MENEKNNQGLTIKDSEIKEIHMPSNSGLPFIMGVAFGVAGFFLVFEWHIAAAIAAIGIIAGLIYRSFDYDEGYHIPVDEIKETESKWRNVEGEVHNYVK